MLTLFIEDKRACKYKIELDQHDLNDANIQHTMTQIKYLFISLIDLPPANITIKSLTKEEHEEFSKKLKHKDINITPEIVMGRSHSYPNGKGD